MLFYPELLNLHDESNISFTAQFSSTRKNLIYIYIYMFLYFCSLEKTSVPQQEEENRRKQDKGCVVYNLRMSAISLYSTHY